MSDYENEYNNMLNALKNGENPFKRSEQVEKWHEELDNEKFKCEMIYQERQKKKESEERDNHFQLWSERAVEDNDLECVFGKTPLPKKKN
jgi:hypothetical protein